MKNHWQCNIKVSETSVTSMLHQPQNLMAPAWQSYNFQYIYTIFREILISATWSLPPISSKILMLGKAKQNVEFPYSLLIKPQWMDAVEVFIYQVISVIHTLSVKYELLVVSLYKLLLDNIDTNIYSGIVNTEDVIKRYYYTKIKKQII